jgi:hypothetical protein
MGTERVGCISYLYDLDYPESKRTPDFTLDGFHASNVARFINHRYLTTISCFLAMSSTLAQDHDVSGGRVRSEQFKIKGGMKVELLLACTVDLQKLFTQCY